MAKAATNNNQNSFEEHLWDTANKLRGNGSSSEYKHVVLSLIFLKFASDKFEYRRQELIDEGQELYIDMVEFYTMKNVFYLPEESRWSYLKENAKQDDLAKEDIAKIADTYHSWKAPQPPEGGVKLPSALHSSNPALYETLSERAKDMRANSTDAEKALWELLRNKKMGVKFRQQHIRSKFIVDLCCLEKKIIIEVDGEIHKKHIAEDQQRTSILEKEGYRVVRFTNNEVLKKIRQELKKSPLGDLGAYEDIAGYCKSATFEEIKKHNFVLTPGRYVGAEEIEDDGIPFETKMCELSKTLYEQMRTSQELDEVIKSNLKGVGYGE